MPNSKGPRQGSSKKLSNDPRERGISPPQRSIESFEEGERVHLRLDPSIPDGRFHHRYNGHTGTVVGKQGDAYRVRIEDGGKQKTLIAAPVHLATQDDSA
jgi:large subunit ribosomal protein L21e